MRDKIIELLQSDTYKNFYFGGMLTEEFADEIHALYQDELDACEHYRQLQAESLETLRRSAGEQEYVQGRGVGVKADAPYYIVDEAPDWNSDKWNDVHNHTDDCTCRHCHPEHWILDRRNIWIRKIGSLGDEVV